MPIRALIFDLDGVVVAGERAAVAFAREYNLTPDVTGAFFQGDFLDCLVGQRDLKRALTSLLPKWGWIGTVDDYIDFWFKVESTPDHALLADIARLRAKGIPCYLATNQEKYRTDYVAEVMGLANQFDGIFSSARVGFLKPDTRFYGHILRSLAPLTPQDIMFLDDSIQNVKGARQAGMQAEVYTGYSDFRSILAGLELGFAG